MPALKIFYERESDLTVGESKALESQDVLLITKLRSAVRSGVQSERPGYGSAYRTPLTDDAKYLAVFDHLRRLELIYDAQFTDAGLRAIMDEVHRKCCSF